VSILKGANLVLRFLLELCALAALCYWGFKTGSVTLSKVGLGIGAPLLAAVPRMRPAATPSPYPELSFDVAFLVPPGVAAAELEAVLREAGGDLLARLTLFDAYQGPPLPPGHRNLAYRVALQAADRTLTDADGAAARDRMAALAAERLQAVLRTAG
jgi:phenylalanyl-tRNA synthetase beta chain